MGEVSHVKALAYGRVLGGGAFCGRGTPVNALAYGRVLGGGVFYGRGTPVNWPMVGS